MRRWEGEGRRDRKLLLCLSGPLLAGDKGEIREMNADFVVSRFAPQYHSPGMKEEPEKWMFAVAFPLQREIAGAFDWEDDKRTRTRIIPFLMTFVVSRGVGY